MHLSSWHSRCNCLNKISDCSVLRVRSCIHFQNRWISSRAQVGPTDRDVLYSPAQSNPVYRPLLSKFSIRGY
jgi:hypothetical protein